ncbi:DNA starvation/stationary phase protection protein [Candidatus Babeliales bacterium]|nr:DNA starvation/stationary phase protection protein [Candidatus Babeliales bacterium]
MSKSEAKISPKILNVILANQGVLLFQTLNYHWNLEGKEFHDYHLLFDKQYNQLFENMDVVAERVRAVGGFTLGSMKDFVKEAVLKEDSAAAPEPKVMVKNLLKQYELLIKNLKTAHEAIEAKTDDYGSINMIEDLIQQYEKTAWMLRSLAR